MINTHSPAYRKLSRYEQLISRAVLGPNGCLIWQGAKGKGEYGQARFGDKKTSAHAAVWLASGRVIPPGHEIDHTCNVRLCINLEHLQAVTHAFNMAEAARRREINAQRFCKYGHLKVLISNRWVCRPCAYRNVRRCLTSDPAKMERDRKWHREYMRKNGHKYKKA